MVQFRGETIRIDGAPCLEFDIVFHTLSITEAKLNAQREHWPSRCNQIDGEREECFIVPLFCEFEAMINLEKGPTSENRLRSFRTVSGPNHRRALSCATQTTCCWEGDEGTCGEGLLDGSLEL